MLKKKRKKKSKQTAWKNSFYYRAYELAREGKSDNAIAPLLGISRPTFRTFKRTRPTFRRALRDGRKHLNDKSGPNLQRYIYNRLPHELQLIWDKLNTLDTEPNGIRRVELLLENKGKRARQQLFLHALTTSEFNPSEACRKVCVSLKKLKQWINSDPDFAALVDEVLEHKKNFFEGCLVRRCAQGDTAAIIFTNKTLNRDRGYAEIQQHDHSGEINQKSTYSIKELDAIPLADRIKLLNAIREQEQLNDNRIIDAPQTAIAAR